ncbi:turripeptide Pal9.2-like [Pomacea canaliculata]|uniref:turripeptide Pal9.2-like n=1 Tax=Pomacea canaliculata TaxID=400727 RepID=UPI000D725A95|nr:turripeptide Pal9.2-like [Pomacea canaliculata]
MKIFVALCLLCIVMVDSTQGECVPTKPCTFDYFPLCGSDGRTYGNWCTFKAQIDECQPNLRLSSCGECRQVTSTRECEPLRACPRHYKPVCGSDGRTYGNWCLFKAELQLCNSKLDLVHCGACRKD